MKRRALTIDHQEYEWDIRSHRRKSPSKLHLEARKLLKKKLKNHLIMEEVTFRVIDYKVLSFDFFIPLINLAVEIQGEQHFKFSPFFHKNKMDFIRGKENDSKKEEWALINDITILHLNYDEDLAAWTKKLKNIL